MTENDLRMLGLWWPLIPRSHLERLDEGTRLGRQELLGQLILETEGALWTREMLEAARDGKRSTYARVVVAIDPAVTSGASSNLTGIVCAGVGHDRRGYVIADLSGRYSPDQWARVAIDAYRTHKADRVVAEGNQGGDLVRHCLATVDPNIPISMVHASRSKQARAEPVAALYEQHRITHIEPFPELEDQCCTWEPLSGDPSPDRLDAMVWAMTNLMLVEPEHPRAGGRPRHMIATALLRRGRWGRGESKPDAHRASSSFEDHCHRRDHRHRGSSDVVGSGPHSGSPSASPLASSAVAPTLRA